MTTAQIYWGAVPFVIIQVIMVGLAIAFPQMIMHYKGTGTGIDPATLDIQIPNSGGGDFQLPDFGAPAPPDFGANRRQAPAAPPLDLSQPPSFELSKFAGVRVPRIPRHGRSNEGGERAPPLERLGALLAHHEIVERALGDLPPEVSLAPDGAPWSRRPS